ncbi:MAG: DUF502 domain-containing protein [Balneolaceae bacterium]|nr:DUF502 domain-containing protein [Balneolaceae bacterium]
MKNIVNYFFRGLLFVFPVVATLYIIIAAVQWSNTVFNDLLYQWLGVDIPGLGIITVFFAVSLIGYLFSRAFVKPVVGYFDRFMAKVPLVKIIYTALKELTEAFVGDKKRFNKPVIADFNQAEGNTVKRIGFITQTDLANLGLTDMVAVYCPHSYNFSGNLYLVPKKAVTPVELSSADVMKYVVSAGVTKLKN